MYLKPWEKKKHKTNILKFYYYFQIDNIRHPSRKGGERVNELWLLLLGRLLFVGIE
jgi:hypothetical protein